jgi:DNA invertase Pin-like site-specific DNA recombinase
MHSIAYARVSTEDQNVENQCDELLKHVPREMIFYDKGVSGTTDAKKRPGFRRMLEYLKIHKGEIDRIYVFEVSRLGRTFLETLNLIKEIESTGVKIWSLSPTEAFMRAEDSACRDLLMSIMTWTAQQERANLKARQKFGIAQAKANGVRFGKPKMQLNVDEIHRLQGEGKTTAEIAEILGVCRATVSRRLNRK